MKQTILRSLIAAGFGVAAGLYTAPEALLAQIPQDLCKCTVVFADFPLSVDCVGDATHTGTCSADANGNCNFVGAANWTPTALTCATNPPLARLEENPGGNTNFDATVTQAPIKNFNLQVQCPSSPGPRIGIGVWIPHFKVTSNSPCTCGTELENSIASQEWTCDPDDS